MRELVSLAVIFLSAAAAAASFECGRQYYDRTCPNELCCSRYGYCNLTEAHCSLNKGCQSYCWTGEGSASNVVAYYNFYNPRENDWNLNTTGVACAARDGNKTLSWRSKFGWTAFCGPSGPPGQAACGKCVRVINTEKNKGKYVFEIVRVVDTCQSGGFVLDFEVFQRLDFDGKGNQRGHLNLDYHFVECEDEDNLDFNGGKNILLPGI